LLFAGWRLLQGCLVDFAGRVAFARREGAARATVARGLCLAALLTLPAVVDGGVFKPELDFKFRNELHSAYISSSSGGTGETRPMLTQTISGYYNLGEWGKVGGYAWTRSALTDQKDEYRRRAFECFEYGIEYFYTWKFDKDLSLYNYFDHLWSPAPGWYEHDRPLQGIILSQALNNPWVTPYYTFLGVYYPNQWETLKLGLRQPFRVLYDGLVVTPYAEILGGDRRRYRSKYGDDPFDTYCSIGPYASEFGVVVTYKVSDFISTRLRFRNWNLINRAAREHEKGKDEPWHVCWLSVVTFAVDVTF